MKENGIELENYIETGVLGKTHGVNGFLKFYTSNTIKNLKDCGNLLIKTKDNKLFNIEILDVKDFADSKIIKFHHYENKEDAAVLTGSQVLVPTEFASPLEEGEVYYKDLIGLNVIFENKVVGRVESLIEGSQSVILEVISNNNKKYLVPYLKVFVSEPDLKNRTIELLEKTLLEL